ncbi:MAG: NAD(P)H-hydrate dehydratase [Flavobacteriia bacterium]|nr:NAD(P)H-hydrate dehydratase [Flavobacteriia bacterium]
MKLFSSSQIREIDKATIENEPISSIDLVERAASTCSDWIIEGYDHSVSFHVFCGMGNNGADGLAIARHLAMAGYNVNVFAIAHRSTGAPNFSRNIERLSEVKLDVHYVNDRKEMPVVDEQTVAIDAILGIGLDKPLRGILKDVVQAIREGYDHVISIDVPTGLPSDLNSEIKINECVEATHTLTFQFPKLSFLVAGFGEYTGDVHVMDIGLDEEAIHDIQSPYHLITEYDVIGIRPDRKAFSHKGDYGHALIAAGHKGMLGAAVLSTKACLRSGAGLVTTHVPGMGGDVLQISAPEAMVQLDHNETSITSIPIPKKITAVGVGPGLGREKSSFNALTALLEEVDVPLLIDADALHLMSITDSWSKLPANSILTPHAGEFHTMTGEEFVDSISRLEAARSWAKEHNCVVLLKGAYSAICDSDGSVYFNGSGHPALAAGGSGDVLSGIITGLLAQGIAPLKAAILGAWIHGKAGEEVAIDRGEHALIASDLIDYLS